MPGYPGVRSTVTRTGAKPTRYPVRGRTFGPPPPKRDKPKVNRNKPKSTIIINPKNPQITLGGLKPTVVATLGTPKGTVTRPPTTNTVTGPKATGGRTPKNPHGNKGTTTTRGGNKSGNKGGNKGGGKVTKPVNTPTVGFDPKKMAGTLTDLAYDADLAEIQRQIDMNRGNMEEALKDIQAWANQVSTEQRSGSLKIDDAYKAAGAEMKASDAHIADLFGGAAGGEAAAYSGVGENVLSAQQAADAAFQANLSQVLSAQALDYQRRARSEFNQGVYDLQGQYRDKLTEKGQARAQNLLQLMEMAWGRKQDILQYQTAQEALRQSRAMAGLDVQKAQQDITAGKQGIKQNQLNLKAQQIAIRKAQVELRKLIQNPNGVDWNDPATRSQIGNAAFSGSLSTRNTFMVNPRIALENAQIALAQMGMAGDPRAQAAIRAAFMQVLNLSHAHHQWMAYSVNSNGQVVYDPTKKKKKR